MIVSLIRARPDSSSRIRMDKLEYTYYSISSAIDVVRDINYHKFQRSNSAYL